MLRENLEQIANKYYEDIIYILKANDEQYTENNTGYFFDLTKLKEKTIDDLKLFIQSKPNNEIVIREHRNSFSLETPEINDNKKHEYTHTHADTHDKSKTNVEENGTNVTPSQKFINEYNIDFNKTTEKTSTLLKFMNAKKKYIRNPETLLSKNEAQLMKQAYIM
jgi:hypothetical protein